MKKKAKLTKFDIIVHIMATLAAVVVLYPLVLIVSCSFSTPDLVSSGKVVLLPKGFTLAGYKAVFENKDILTGYANTIFYTVFGTITRLVVTLPASYALSKGKSIPGNNFFMMMVLFTMYFSGGMIPTFLVVNALGLYNTRFYIIIWGAFTAYNCIVSRSFFAEIPNELEEAAYIDGCSVIGTFVKIIMPISKALLGVMVLYMAIGHWNGYFVHMIYLRDDARQPLSVFLRRILIVTQQMSELEESVGAAALELAQREQLIRYAVIIVAAAPLLIIYPFLQKYFDKGVLIGSLKG